MRSGAPAAGEHALATSVYVYGVVRTGAPGEVGAAAVRTVAGDGLAAVVGDVPASWRSAGRADVEAHDRVLSELSRHTTVVPMRFGIVMESDDEVRERLLEAHAAQLDALLTRLAGRVQMSVKAYYAENALLRRAVARHPQLKRRSRELDGLPVDATHRERIDLGRDVAAALQEQRALDERMLVEPLARVAEDVRVDPPVSDRQAATIQLLIDEGGRPALDDAVQRLADEHGAHFAFRYVGPLPPYSFCDISLEPWG